MLFNRYRPGVPSVVLLRAKPTTDSYGEPVEGWGEPADWTPLPDALVQDRTSVETDTAGRQILRVQKALIHPGRLDVTSADRVQVDGVTYRIEGDPRVRIGLRGASHTTADLVRVSG